MPKEKQAPAPASDRVTVEILQRWTGVTFDFKPGDVVQLPPNDAKRLSDGGVCKIIDQE